MRLLRSSILGKRWISQLPRYFGPETLRHSRSHAPTMSTDRPRYKHIDDVERLDYYEKGGYHTIYIGDWLHKRYRIVHKLGYGSYSTAWLARDEQLSKFVAIKLVNHGGEDRVVRALFSPVLDRFDVYGPNGTHPCLVTSPAACSLADTMVAGDHAPFQINVARSLAAQLTMAAAYIHSVGLAHGDLHFGNLLLQLPAGIDGLTDQQLYDQYDPPELELVVREDQQPLSSTGVPSHVYAPIWMGSSSNELSLGESKLVLADFGVAFQPVEESRFDSYTPLEIRPPETRFEPTTPLTLASDNWSLGCMVWAILGVQPFLGAS